MTQGLTSKDSRRFASVTHRHSEYSKFVDRVNAQRFKAMVGGLGQSGEDSPKIGLPFSIERPHAVVAHRRLEHQLKPAARKTRQAAIGR